MSIVGHFNPKKCILVLHWVSLKSKDITTPNHFETRSIRAAQLCPVMFEKQRKQKRKHQHYCGK